MPADEAASDAAPEAGNAYASQILSVCAKTKKTFLDTMMKMKDREEECESACPPTNQVGVVQWMRNSPTQPR